MVEHTPGRLAASPEEARVPSDESARASLLAAMRNLQALTNELRSAISRVQGRHDDPAVLEDLLVVDHASAQVGRRVQAIAVLCGGWPGRQRGAVALLDVARGATARIRDYLRVEIRAEINPAVMGRFVEPVVLAVAELLDNAARHSQPQARVQVTIRKVQNGANIVIDDAGVGMNEQEITRATRFLSGEVPIDVTKLGDPPAFGLPVAAVLANRYGFRVSLDSTSPYGGVRAVVFLPNALLDAIEGAAASSSPPSVEPALNREAESDVETEAAAAESVESPAMPGTTETPGAVDAAADVELPSPAGGQLPKRRRHVPTGQAGDDASAGEASPAHLRPAREAATAMGAFQRGTRAGRAAAPEPDPAPELGAAPEPTEPPTPEGKQHR
jgi:hypothetical protein